MNSEILQEKAEIFEKKRFLICKKHQNFAVVYANFKVFKFFDVILKLFLLL